MPRKPGPKATCPRQQPNPKSAPTGGASTPPDHQRPYGWCAQTKPPQWEEWWYASTQSHPTFPRYHPEPALWQPSPNTPAAAAEPPAPTPSSSRRPDLGCPNHLQHQWLPPQRDATRRHNPQHPHQQMRWWLTYRLPTRTNTNGGQKMPWALLLKSKPPCHDAAHPMYSPWTRRQPEFPP